MARPIKPRKVCCDPCATYFLPQGIDEEEVEEVKLSLDELEALRLKDMVELDQTKAAEQMMISRPTFQRILTSAHKKVATALIEGKALRIEKRCKE